MSKLQTKGTHPVLQLCQDGQTRASFCPKQTPEIHGLCHTLSSQQRAARPLAQGFSWGSSPPPLLPPASSQAQPALLHKAFLSPFLLFPLLSRIFSASENPLN